VTTLTVDPYEWVRTTGVDLLLEHGAATLRDEEGNEVVGWYVEDDTLWCNIGGVASGHTGPDQAEITSGRNEWRTVVTLGRPAAADAMIHTMSTLRDHLAVVARNAIRAITQLAGAGIPTSFYEGERDAREPRRTYRVARNELDGPISELDAALATAAGSAR
jgi:hypothetical protein